MPGLAPHDLDLTAVVQAGWHFTGPCLLQVAILFIANHSVSRLGGVVFLLDSLSLLYLNFLYLPSSPPPPRAVVYHSVSRLEGTFKGWRQEAARRAHLRSVLIRSLLHWSNLNTAKVGVDQRCIISNSPPSGDSPGEPERHLGWGCGKAARGCVCTSAADAVRCAWLSEQC